MLSASAAFNTSDAAQSGSVDQTRVDAPLAAPTSETDVFATSGVLVSTASGVRVKTAPSASETSSDAVHSASSVSVSTQVSTKRAHRPEPTSPLAQRSAKRVAAGDAEPEDVEVSDSPERAPSLTPLKTPACAALEKFAYAGDESPKSPPPLRIVGISPMQVYSAPFQTVLVVSVPPPSRASTTALTPVSTLSTIPSATAGRSFESASAPALPASASSPASYIDLSGDEFGVGTPATPLRYPHMFETTSSFAVPHPSTNAAADKWECELDTSSTDQS